MTIVRELVTFLGYEVDDKALKVAEKGFESLKKLAKATVTAVGAVTGALAALAYETAEYADDVSKAAQAIGISTAALQELEYAASTARVEAQGVRNVLRDLSKNAGEAANGNAELAGSFYRIGVSMRDSSGKIKPADALLEEVGNKIARIPDAAKRTAFALKLMGGDGAKMLPIFAKGKDALVGLRKEAAVLGLVMGEDAIREGESFAREISTVRYEVAALGRAIGVEVIPYARQLLAWLRAAAKGNRDLAKSSARATLRGMARALEVLAIIADRIGRPLAGLVSMVDGLGNASKLAGAALGFVFLHKLGKGIIAIKAAAKAGGGLFRILKLLTLAPAITAIKWLALAAVVGLVIDDILTFIRGGDSELGYLLNKLKEPIREDDFFIVKMLKKAVGLIDDLMFKTQQYLAFVGLASAPVDPRAFDPGPALEKHTPKIRTMRYRRADKGEFPAIPVDSLGAGMRLISPDGRDVANDLMRGFVPNAGDAARGLGAGGARSSTVTLTVPVNVEVDARGAQDARAVGVQVGGAVQAQVQAGIRAELERAKLSADGVIR